MAVTGTYIPTIRVEADTSKSRQGLELCGIFLLSSSARDSSYRRAWSKDAINNCTPSIVRTNEEIPHSDSSRHGSPSEIYCKEFSMVSDKGSPPFPREPGERTNYGLILFVVDVVTPVSCWSSLNRTFALRLLAPARKLFIWSRKHAEVMWGRYFGLHRNNEVTLWK